MSTKKNTADTSKPNNAADASKPNNAENSGPEFGIQRIYAKTSSIETPVSPQIFLAEWHPELNMDLETKSSVMEDNHYEVTLRITVTVKVKEKTAFIVEVQQSGIFAMKGFDDEQLKRMLGSFCPNVLYPYAREFMTSLVTHAGFPQLYLTPVNFDALYEQHLQEQNTTDTH